MSTHTEVLYKAAAFAEAHTFELAKNIEEWHGTSILPPDCSLRHLSEILRTSYSIHDSRIVAERIANSAIRNKFIELSARRMLKEVNHAVP